MKLPNRWQMYTKSARIKNTPFVACKTPLREGYSTVLSPENSFTPRLLLMNHPEIKLVVDLTNTYKYYNGNQEFVQNGVKYLKIGCDGHGVIPRDSQFVEFVRAVEEFRRTNPRNHLIAVHCTHGVNRTGYFIVRFMIEKMGYGCEKALKTFALSRGHPIERNILVTDLRAKSQNITVGLRRSLHQTRPFLVNPEASPSVHPRRPRRWYCIHPGPKGKQYYAMES